MLLANNLDDTYKVNHIKVCYTVHIVTGIYKAVWRYIYLKLPLPRKL